MCGIIAGIAQRDIAPILLQGLKRLEYRGYDSAGLGVLTSHDELARLRVCGKVDELVSAQKKSPLIGKIGLAHTRWATHGKPSEENAHPHVFEDEIALVHNGIIENYLALREKLNGQGAHIVSDTDTEVIVQYLGQAIRNGEPFLNAFQSTLKELKGAYSLAVVSKMHPDRIWTARMGSPVVIGIGIGEHYVASDSLALLPFTQDFVILEEGDMAEVFRDHFVVYDQNGQQVERKIRKVTLQAQSAERGNYRHFMQKEIYEQPQALSSATMGRVVQETIPDAIFGTLAASCFDNTRAVQIVACGTSYHAGLVGKHWIESIAGLPCEVEVASEMRYRRNIIRPGTLFVALSQSGETADTLAALRGLPSEGYSGKLSICNVPESSLVRESECVLLTHAGPEIGVASTKAFTTQLGCLLMLVQCLAQRNDPERARSANIPAALKQLPKVLADVLTLDKRMAEIATRFDGKEHALYVGRGLHYPIAKEGALKLKEVSYIHAEAYQAGELKHGPLALVDKNMPVVALAPNGPLLDKLLSNLQEISARQGKLIVLTESGTNIAPSEDMEIVEVPARGELLTPFTFSVLLQLLAYHVAVMKGTDVDQPRNLAKSVTVE